MKPPIIVTITGAAGQIAYSLLFVVGKGDVFGANQVICFCGVVAPFLSLFLLCFRSFFCLAALLLWCITRAVALSLPLRIISSAACPL